MPVGSFQLILDTTGPNIEIVAPSHTTESTKTDISVIGNETLSNYQEFYFIDSLGNRHDVTMDYQGDRFNGSFYFNDFPKGIVTFYAKVKDEVDNPSALESESINILQRAYMDIEISDSSRSSDLSDLSRLVNATEETRNVSIDETSRTVTVMELTRRIEVIVDG